MQVRIEPIGSRTRGGSAAGVSPTPEELPVVAESVARAADAPLKRSLDTSALLVLNVLTGLRKTVAVVAGLTTPLHADGGSWAWLVYCLPIVPRVSQTVTTGEQLCERAASLVEVDSSSLTATSW